MSFYGLLILQKTNFKLASNLTVTPKKQTSNSLSIFLSNPKDWYVIAVRRVITRERVCHYQRCISAILRIDNIHFFLK